MKRIERIKTDFFYHKKHKRVLVKVDGLSLLEHRFEKFDKSKKNITKGTKGCWWRLMGCRFWNADETD